MTVVEDCVVKADSNEEKEPIQPEGWKLTVLSDLLEVKYGKGLPKNTRKPNGVPVYGSNGIIGQHGIPLTKGPAIIIGRKGTVGAVHFSEVPCWPIDTTYFIDEFQGLDSAFIVYALRSINLSYFDTSTAIPGLNREDLYNQKIPLPPLEEQKRIVAKIEELLPRVNAVRERLIRVKEIMKRFRQSVLSAACSGRLTADWRDETPITEPAEEWLKRVISERAKILDVNKSGTDKRGNSRVLMKPEIKEPNPEFATDVPDSWAKASMDALTSLVTSGSRAWKRFYVEEGQGTFIMGQNVRPFRLDLSRRVAVDPPEGDPDRRRSEVIEGDLLVTIAGNTGDVCKVSAPLKQHYVCQSVALMRPILPSMSAFLETYLNSPLHGQFQFRKWVYGEGRPHLSFDHLKSLCVLLPPFEEQEEIVRRVDLLFKLADKIEKRVEVELSRTEKLTQAILAKAFRGELVPTEAELGRREERVGG